MAIGDKKPVVMQSDRAVPSGIATLGTDGKLLDAQIPSLAKLGAAPAGYGLGVNAVGGTGYIQVNREEADNLWKTGVYWFVDVENPWYADDYNSGKYGLLIHLQHNANSTVAAKQIFIPHQKVGAGDSSGRDTYVVVERTRRNSAYAGERWTPIEWRNPPMHLGMEYRTTERYMGKPVYVKMLIAKTLAATGTTNFPHGATDLEAVIAVSGVAGMSPMIRYPGITDISANATNLVVETSGATAVSATPVIKYIKTA